MDGTPDPAEAALPTLERLLSQRYSCRSFLPREVPRSDIVRVLAVAQKTASWCNAQPWQAVIASGPAVERLRAALCERAGAAKPAPDFPWPREYRGVYRERRRECGYQLYDSVGIAHDDKEAAAKQRMENFRFFGAPHVAIVTTDEALGVYGAIGCGAYVNNFMLAAHALGIASIAQAAIASYPDVLRAHLPIPEGRLVVCAISFGFEDPAHPVNRFRTTRAAVDDVVTWQDT